MDPQSWKLVTKSPAALKSKSIIFNKFLNSFQKGFEEV